MKIPLDLINGVSIARPCPASWGQMSGDNRARHCSLCDQAVFDLSVMTAADVALLLGAHDEDVCVRLYRRADGTVMTSDCPKGVAAATVAILSWVAVAAVSLLGFFLLRGSDNLTGGPATRGYKMGKIDLPRAKNQDAQQGPVAAAPE